MAWWGRETSISHLAVPNSALALTAEGSIVQCRADRIDGGQIGEDSIERDVDAAVAEVEV